MNSRKAGLFFPGKRSISWPSQYGTAQLTYPEAIGSDQAPAGQREQTKENDDEDHDACRGGGAFAWRRLRLRRTRATAAKLPTPSSPSCPAWLPRHRASRCRARSPGTRRAARRPRRSSRTTAPGPGCSLPTRATADQTVATDAEGGRPQAGPFSFRPARAAAAVLAGIAVGSAGADLVQTQIELFDLRVLAQVWPPAPPGRSGRSP